MNNSRISIRGARQHNLKNINVEIPHNKMVVITGVSGSGKSSLAMDTIFAEGQRRFLESLSSYARQFLGELEKPDVDSIEGLSPSIAIEQKMISRNPRSIVGTVTEIYDYLRVLYANIGIAHCPNCGRKISPQTSTQIVEQILTQNKKNSKIVIKAPVVRARKGLYQDLLEKLRRQGYARVEIDGIQYSLSEEIILDKYKKHDIDVIVDRLVISDEIRKRLSDSVESSLKLGEGIIKVETLNEEKNNEQIFSEQYACVFCNLSFPELSPRMFSFNTPYGSCKKCNGLGSALQFLPSLIIGKDLSKSLEDSNIRKISGFKSTNGYSWQVLSQVVKYYGADTQTPIKDLDPDLLEKILYGTGDEEIQFDLRKDEYESRFNKRNEKINTNFQWRFKRPFEGLIPLLYRRYIETSSKDQQIGYSHFMVEVTCPKCKGQRLNPFSLSVLVGGKNIAEICDLSVKDTLRFFNKLKLTEFEKTISKEILKEIKDRLSFLINVGLDYISLSRKAQTLSVGESERIRLATQLGSNLVGVTYVLDEPTIGLHTRDISKLIKMLKKLRDMGNTVVIVEHDESVIRDADYIIDLGPFAGEKGGYLVATGAVEDIISNEKSITGKYLSGQLTIPLPDSRRKINDKFLRIKGARENNLKNIDVKIPLEIFVCVTGVSGAGKTSLFIDCLYKGLKSLMDSKERFHKIGDFDQIFGFQNIDKIINIDQSPIGRTPRSVPATYTKALDYIREIFANLPEAKERGYAKGRFSFNVKGGRCGKCQGTGYILKEMLFLPDVYIKCDLCKGKRYNDETLDIKFKGYSIADVLKMSFSKAYRVFKNIPNLKRTIKTIIDVGLGYLELGQSSTTLSGGEAQRLKIARELRKISTGNTLYLLDEPTTGLHFDDVKKLINVLQKLTDKGNTVIVIEHNMEIVKSADYIIDLGPEGGEKGGRVVIQGTPEEIIENKTSYTAQFLKKYIT
jgi:excinuclease ABC subunit A